MSDQSDAKTIKDVNSARFRWHELVLADRAIKRSGCTVALAGHVMHRFRSDKNYAEFSIRSAAKELSISERTVCRARQKLVDRGWIVFIGGPRRDAPGWSANRYQLAFGRDDQDRCSVDELEQGSLDNDRDNGDGR